MKRAAFLFCVLLAAAAIGHYAALALAPRVIMTTALEKMADRGVPLHAFAASPRITPQTQTVVRPSPDLAYSICRYDFDQTSGPIEIVAARSQALSSISFYDASTNNFARYRLDANASDGPTTLALRGPRDAGPDGERSTAIRSPTTRGLVLIRRLAPTADAYDAARALAGQDRCGS
ncbi:MAG: DUF1254 domain-containing protein [Pseudomonadota bacterium]